MRFMIIDTCEIIDFISGGKINKPLFYIIIYHLISQAVNEVDSTRPPDVQYVSQRQLAPEVKMSKDPGFMVSCDCVDNCSVSNFIQ